MTRVEGLLAWRALQPGGGHQVGDRGLTLETAKKRLGPNSGTRRAAPIIQWIQAFTKFPLDPLQSPACG